MGNVNCNLKQPFLFFKIKKRNDTKYFWQIVRPWGQEERRNLKYSTLSIATLPWTAMVKDRGLSELVLSSEGME